MTAEKELDLELQIMRAWADFGKASARRNGLVAELQAWEQELQRLYALIAQLEAEKTAEPPAPEPQE